jgi:predicted porin
MKKHLLALAALAAISGVAVAQSNVTIYGTVDLAVQSMSKVDTAGARRTALESGGLSPSILGFRGTEDLGGGLKASFNLEGHLAADSGAGQQWGGLFGRQANVGLSSSLGSLTLGKQYTAAVLAYAATDPRGLKETNSGLMAWATSQKPLTVDHSGTDPINNQVPIDVFMANAITASTQLGPVSLSAQYAMGEVKGQTSANTAQSYGAVYSANGLTLSAGFQSQNGNNVNTDKDKNSKTFGGIGYKFGPATVKANYLQTKSYNANAAVAYEYHIAGFGVDYATSAKNSVTVAYYDTKNKVAGTSGDTSKVLILSDEYALSKRTTLYATYANGKQGVNYTGGSAFGNATAAFPATANTTASQWLLGVRHTF